MKWLTKLLLFSLVFSCQKDQIDFSKKYLLSEDSHMLFSTEHTFSSYLRLGNEEFQKMIDYDNRQSFEITFDGTLRADFEKYQDKLVFTLYKGQGEIDEIYVGQPDRYVVNQHKGKVKSVKTKVPKNFKGKIYMLFSQERNHFSILDSSGILQLTEPFNNIRFATNQYVLEDNEGNRYPMVKDFEKKYMDEKGLDDITTEYFISSGLNHSAYRRIKKYLGTDEAAVIVGTIPSNN